MLPLLTWPFQLLSSSAAAAAAVAAGISRLMLDSFPNDPVLYVSEQGPADAAAVLLSSSQEAEMVARQDLSSLDFAAIPGTLQMLQVGLFLPGMFAVAFEWLQWLFFIAAMSMQAACICNKGLRSHCVSCVYYLRPVLVASLFTSGVHMVH
jgi:hypothetical protein